MPCDCGLQRESRVKTLRTHHRSQVVQVSPGPFKTDHVHLSICDHGDVPRVISRLVPERRQTCTLFGMESTSR